MQLTVNERKNIIKRNNISNNRLEYIDVARGIAIILMVIGHVIEKGWKRNIIFSFHMPLFIILSGIFYKEKSFKETIINIVKKLILPYIICALITDIIICNFDIKNTVLLWGKQILFSYTFWNKTNFNTDAIRLGALWFFPLLALIKLIFFSLKKIFKESDFALFGACSLLMYIGYFVGIKGYWLPFSLDVVLVSLIFYFIGYILGTKKIIKELINNWKVIVICATIWIIGIKYNSIELAIRNYNDMFFSILTAICGSLVILKVSYVIASKTKVLRNILMWYGKNSMYVLLLHHIEESLINYNFIYNYTIIAYIVKYVISIIKLTEITIGVFIINITKKAKLKLKEKFNEKV